MALAALRCYMYRFLSLVAADRIQFVKVRDAQGRLNSQQSKVASARCGYFAGALLAGRRRLLGSRERDKTGVVRIWSKLATRPRQASPRNRCA